MADYVKAAFDTICENANDPESWYVVLVESIQCYGGPEEGGWYYTANRVEAFKEYATKKKADAVAKRVAKLAKELQAEARRSHGEHCLNQMAWLEARGLDADYFPEDDGPAEYDVLVLQEVPVYDNRRPAYC